jgi:hypothetical protein
MKTIFKCFLFVLLIWIPLKSVAGSADNSFTYWIEYKNDSEGYSIKFPPGFRKDEEGRFIFPEKYSRATGFHAQYIKILSGEKACDANAGNDFAEFEWKDTIIINGITYRVGEASDGAAGTIYYGTFFVTQYNKTCYRLVFVRSHSVGGYYGDDEKENKKLDANILKNDNEMLELSKKILSTMKFGVTEK